MLRNRSEKLGAKFLSTTLGYFVVRISCLDDAFSGILELKARAKEGEQLQKDRKRRQGEAKKNCKKTESQKT